MTIEVSLRRLNEDLLRALLAVAVSDAAPEEVMPPVAGPPGWTADRISALRTFYRDRLPGLDGPYRTLMFAIVADGEVVGMIRLSRTDQPGAMETGVWLGRSARGLGVGTAALRKLVDEAAAAGAHEVFAETTAGNLGAVRALRRCGARIDAGHAKGITDGALVGTADHDATVRAVIAVPPPVP